jgi:hypothetical protein
LSFSLASGINILWWHSMLEGASLLKHIIIGIRATTYGPR